MRSVIIGALFLAVSGLAHAQDSNAPEPAPPTEPNGVEVKKMTLATMGDILLVLDPETKALGTRFTLTVQDVPVLVVTDPIADRMRAMVPIRSIEGMGPEELMRVMQANFDTALDARYAVARGRLWGVFIHPLSPLDRRQLISGIGQSVNLALSYGKSYSSGGLSFSQGDTGDAQRALIDELLKRGEDI